MNNGKVRIYELSKELELENKDILAICEGLDIAVKSHSSTITEEDATRIKSAAKADGYKPVSKAVRPAKAQRPNRAAKPSAPKPARPRQQQILEIRRYPKPATPPEADRPAAAAAAKPEATAAAAKPAAAASAPSAPNAPSAPSLASPPPRPARPGAASAASAPSSEAPKSAPAATASKPPTAIAPPPARPTASAPAREPAKPAAPAPEKIVTTSGASPEQLKPRLVAPPSRPSSKPAPGRGDDGGAPRVARPVLKRDRNNDNNEGSRPSRPAPDGRGVAQRRLRPESPSSNSSVRSLVRPPQKVPTRTTIRMAMTILASTIRPWS